MVYKLIRWGNILSIDVAIGAVACALFFAKLRQREIDIVSCVVLGFAVWIIYTVDHLYDAAKLKSKALSIRHAFHQRHSATLIKLLLVAGLLVAVLLFYMPPHVLFIGSSLSIIVLLYLLLHTKLKVFKEFCIAILYTIGVLVPSLSNPDELLAVPTCIVWSFALTALLNLLIFSWFDYHEDQVQDTPSLVTVVGLSASGYLIYFLFCVNVFLLVVNYAGLEYLIVLAMNGILMAIFAFPKSLKKNDRYRLYGDAIFLLPLLYLIF